MNEAHRYETISFGLFLAMTSLYVYIKAFSFRDKLLKIKFRSALLRVLQRMSPVHEIWIRIVTCGGNTFQCSVKDKHFLD